MSSLSFFILRPEKTFCDEPRRGSQGEFVGSLIRDRSRCRRSWSNKRKGKGEEGRKEGKTVSSSLSL